jgi:transcriptional regulator with GAF, ATPase, and Fis domain
MSSGPVPRPEDLQAAISQVARAITESLDLHEVWGRVADGCRLVVPFDGLGVSRLEGGDTVHVYATAGDPRGHPLEEQVFKLQDFSPAIRHQDEDRLILVKDGEKEMDPAYAVDRTMLERGFRSLLRLPLLRGTAILGSLVLVSRQRGAFAEDHGRRLRPLAELVALALEHDRMWRVERERHRRHEALQALLPALAEALDIRSIFRELSRIAHDVIPHEYVSLGLFNEDRSAIHVHATSEAMGKLPEFRFTDPRQAEVFAWDFMLVSDIEIVAADRLLLHVTLPDPAHPPQMEMAINAEWVEVYRRTGVRSQVRVPVRLRGQVAGGLTFHSVAPATYAKGHVELAARVADHVALALAHQQLAEESRRAAAAQDRAEHLEGRVQALVQELDTLSPHRALGRSRKWRDVLSQAAKVAPTDTTVLMTGESGTGKEVVARFVHRGSSRKDGPFVALNCAALPEQLLESELFGHEKGAFTGALATRPGKIEQAAGGVLFLDEVGEMSPAVQAKFLRVLQEKEYQRLGGSRTLKAEARVLAATNRDLKAAIGKGGFREDLYYRLAVFEIALPALRDRPEDVPVLVEAFLAEIGRTVGRPAAGVSDEVRDRLVAYHWPGNVRELRNALERAVILCEGGLITSEHLPMGIVAAQPAEASFRAADGAGTVVSERDLILEALTRTGNNQSKAARLLGMTRAQIRARIEKHGISVES